ncbi:MAG: poly(3-hydroxybutyrate) depolymerase [Chloroflexi bacterium]|nr:poly(3-hydroxybutyrate) depolymerase [Chloroflexota bacterium]
MKTKKVLLIGMSLLVIFVSTGCLAQSRQTPTQPAPVLSETPTAGPAYTLSPGDYDFSVAAGGGTRRYLLHIPAAYDPATPTPIVLAFHGALGSADSMAKGHGWIEKSDQAGFLVAFPNGASRLSSGDFATWNAGSCCGYAVQNQSDDVGYVRAILEDLQTKVNLGQVFAAGMSNGAMFSYRLACEMSDTFSAIAAVAGTDNFAQCNPAQPISILHIHGLEDDRVLFDGGCGPGCDRATETEYVSVPDTIAEWVQRNGCETEPQTVVINENAYSETYAPCQDGVQVKLYVVKDGGHSWPSSKRTSNPLEQDAPSSAIDATKEIWDFFSAVGVGQE